MKLLFWEGNKYPHYFGDAAAVRLEEERHVTVNEW
jgi:hypothetical protein